MSTATKSIEQNKQLPIHGINRNLQRYHAVSLHQAWLSCYAAHANNNGCLGK